MIDIKTAISIMKQYISNDRMVTFVTKTKEGYVFEADYNDERYNGFNSENYVFVMDGNTGQIRGIDFSEYCKLVDNHIVDPNSWEKVESLK